MAMKVWAKITFPDANAEVNRTKSALEEVQALIEVDGINNSLFELEVAAKKDYDLALVLQEKIWAKKITFIYDHFKSFHKRDLTVNSNDILSCIPEIIIMDDNLALMVVPSADEIKAAIFDLDPSSTPGPDGFPGTFYHCCWSIVCPKVCLAVQNFFSEGVITKGFIPKIFAMRISILLPRLISEEQDVFPRGKIISNICMASELANLMHSKSFGGGLALKLDIKKAFDTLDWVFLFDVMHKFGFSQLFTDRLQQIFLSSRLSILINGGLVGFFGVERGLRQGTHFLPSFLSLLKRSCVAR
ncbi:uncharacterized protein LOC122067865 [Macadamia integrifolia]|uniref:uncharacterized protein LOC122067865 n=1 Tax=Macadamia integrifolia TaxID=60698 RepID=UPI001C4F006E|nr:uncharacterized protein LOC122067865 [Macadamia integrifolia]